MAQLEFIDQVCIVGHLRRAARAAGRALDLALAGSGLTASQFSLLAALAAAESAGPVTLGGLARNLVMDRSTLHRNLAPMDQMGLVLLTGRRGRRGTTVALTPRARELLAEALPRWRACQQDLVTRLGEGDSGRLLQATGRITGSARLN